jgi:hypothetical protein
MEDVKDQRHYVPATAIDLEREFPGWLVSRKGLTYYASYGVNEVCGEDLGELRDGIIAWKWRHDG